ncbi:MAG: SufD family Fe-S cluster assembly protein [Candidatus Gracilibacteria bacterium]|nr:SufD family Fe-S cluster assembly protein [Candidatus Gracilibacteria bacterium]
MKITKGGFYFLSDFDNSLEIDVDDKVVIFDDGENNISKIEIFGKADVKIYGFIKKSRNLEIISAGEKTSILVNYLFLGQNDEKIEAKINGKIIKSGNSLEINILGILDDKSVLKLDSGVDIDFQVVGGFGITNTEIIFLGNDAKFSGIPGLRVASNDVKANHSLKIDKISYEAIFYLQARGLEVDSSRNMILRAKVDELYKYFKLCNHSLYEELVTEIFKK